MNYIFINIEANEIFTCKEELWLEFLKTARDNGWEPSGTKYDRALALDNAYDDDDEESFRLFMFITINDEFLKWDGNYTDKADQIVTGNDADNMYGSLVYETQIDSELFDFIGKGSFRILSD